MGIYLVAEGKTAKSILFFFFLEQKDGSQSSSEYVYDKDKQQLQHPLSGRSDVKSVTREDAAPLK